jgi:transcriptional regulator with XRE-family HTH domain
MKAGLTQYDLAYRSSVDISFLSRMERGLTQPSIVTFIHLAKILRISAPKWMKQVILESKKRKPTATSRGRVRRS